MSKRTTSLLAAFVLMTTATLAQYATPDGSGAADPRQSAQCEPATHDSASAAVPPTSKKIVTTSGRISDDGKVFVADRDNVIWRVNNPDVVAASAGMRVTLRAYLDPRNHELRVASVRLVRAAGTRLQDAAFRK
jgi:hypothetical protein